jgi:UDP-2-acetamido-3-amino-2,3-dideoxy-glucuronate N-acetyltransferase
MSDKSKMPCLALVGAGKWGKNLARNFYKLGVLHTICDSSDALLQGHKENYPEVTITSSYYEVLRNPEITRVVLATPASLHYVHAKEALLAGKDVYVEKPLCLDSKEGEELIRIADAGKRILMVGHLLQYHPCVRKLQELLRNGDLGKLQYITSNRLNLGTIRTEENALWSFAPHDISVILSLCGHRLPEEVRCVGSAHLSENVVDVSMTTMRFADNVRAHVFVSWLNPFKEQKLTVVGSEGMIVFDDTQAWEDKLVIYRDYLTWQDGKKPVPNKKEGERVEVEKSEPLSDECKHYISCCDKRISPRTNGTEGLRVLKVLQAAQASLNEDGAGKNPALVDKKVEDVNYFAHPSAIIDPGALIGKDCKVWHFSHVMTDASLGKGCNLGQNVLVSSGVTLGNNVKVQNNVSIYTGVDCEDDVFLGPSMVFTNVNNPRSEVNRRGEYEKTLLRRGTTVGANATIVCGIELGEYSFVGAGAVVTKDVKPYALVVGSPARQIGWMSTYGERLDLPLALAEGGIKTAECPKTGNLYCLNGDSVLPVEDIIDLSDEVFSAASKSES